MRQPGSASSSEIERRSKQLSTKRTRSWTRRRDAGSLVLLALAAIVAILVHLVFSDPAWSAATAGVFWAALAGIVAWALKRLGVGAEAVRLIKAVRGR